MMTAGRDAAVIVVGGGHAGIEAALASARCGAETILLTGDPERICTLPCNPSIGGSAKGQLVRELDALGGEMGRLIDQTSLHSRFLNESKGPAVRALRAQADKPSYVRLASQVVSATDRLTVVRGMAVALEVVAGSVRGVRTAEGRTYRSAAVVLATGTFLGGKTFRGSCVEDAGRFGEPPAIELSGGLAQLGFSMGRLKTGTPPRVARTSVDLGRLAIQMPSAVPLPFSYRSPARFAGPQLPCHIAITNERTHALVRENLHLSPLYGLDLIRGIGPRYCPSIEDKVVKFAHNPTHQLFIEPEGWNEPTLYVGGFSTSLPAEVQLAMLQTLDGFESVEMLRAGYAVEYDFVQPTELDRTLETRRIAGLFHCGQLNGTSGYEEAAVQGLVAGINAAAKAQGRKPFVPLRTDSYIGTLVDDLTAKGVDEPYRMLTSRAEHRVILRHDNADLRLTPAGRELGLIDDATWDAFEARRAGLSGAIRRASETRADDPALPPGTTVAAALRRPEMTAAFASAALGIDQGLAERVEIELKTEGYIKRQEVAIARARRDDAVAIPAGFPYQGIGALSREAREKLERTAPATLGAASRIPGVTPADVVMDRAFTVPAPPRYSRFISTATGWALRHDPARCITSSRDRISARG